MFWPAVALVNFPSYQMTVTTSYVKPRTDFIGDRATVRLARIYEPFTVAGKLCV
jgi:hypothetical protein